MVGGCHIFHCSWRWAPTIPFPLDPQLLLLLPGHLYPLVMSQSPLLLILWTLGTLDSCVLYSDSSLSLHISKSGQEKSQTLQTSLKSIASTFLLFWHGMVYRWIWISFSWAWSVRCEAICIAKSQPRLHNLLTGCNNFVCQFHFRVFEARCCGSFLMYGHSHFRRGNIDCPHLERRNNPNPNLYKSLLSSLELFSNPVY